MSSGLLNVKDVILTLNAVKKSKLYREDQNSYMLYPNRELPGFRSKNVINKNSVQSNKLLQDLIVKNNTDIITKDIYGNYHFNGNFKNVKSLGKALKKLNIDNYKDIENIFEATFNHKTFTGRSGTFFAYEGLGSIYWHMVSKLLLSVQENYFWGLEFGASENDLCTIKNLYTEIQSGLGYKKTAKDYGAFPFDPYSHSPYNKGAKQPGMTGQVKEEVITRMAETGIVIKDGLITFNKSFISNNEFTKTEINWEVEQLNGQKITLLINKGSIAGTHCQIPYIISQNDKNKIFIHTNNS